MAAHFFDPSALVKRYITESGTRWIQSRFDPGAGNQIYVSSLAGAEIVASLVRRARSDRYLARHLSRLLNLFRADWTILLTVIEIDDRVIIESMRLAEMYGLRGADAVHLAAALRLELGRKAAGADPITFISADRDQLAAALREGLRVVDPGLYP